MSIDDVSRLRRQVAELEAVVHALEDRVNRLEAESRKRCRVCRCFAELHDGMVRCAMMGAAAKTVEDLTHEDESGTCDRDVDG
jgi:hypothetical protein